jgi:hypothetical protein
MSWGFCLLFLITGILNTIFVHIVPGVFYVLLSIFFFPPTNNFLKKRFGFSIHPLVKLPIGLFVLWASLAVGELVEILGA